MIKDTGNGLPTGVLELYQIMAEQAQKLNVEWLVVGATARDMVMVERFGAGVERATEDIDLAVKVAGWDC